MNWKPSSGRSIFVALFLGTGLVTSIPSVSWADTHTWTGATSANWSAATNWNEGSAPAPGESNVALVFPLGAANLVNTNNIVGLTVDTITITTAAASPIYTISGNAITLITSLSFVNSGSGGFHPVWYIPLILGSPASIASSGRQSKVRGTIDLNANSLTFNGDGDIWVDGVISGTGSVTKNSNGALTFIAANTYKGPTTANAGAFYIENGSALGNSSSGTTIQGSAYFGLWSGPFTCAEPIAFSGGGIYAYGQNTLSGTITLNGSPNIDVGSTSDRLTISGPIGGPAGFSKSSTGTLVLSGTSSYAGTTSIDDGDLSVTGSITSNVWLYQPTARLLGGGSVGSISYDPTGGIVYPNVDGTPATLTANGGLTGAANGFYVAGMDATHASRLDVNGPVDLGGVALSLDFLGGYSPPFGHTFKVIQNDGTDAVSGTFSGVAEGGLYKTGGMEFNVTYAGGTGNDVNIQLPLSRHAVADFDGDGADEAAVDFGPSGIWMLNGGAWTQLSPDNPESLMTGDLQADGDDEMIADMGSLGLWVWDSGAWSNLTSANPEGLASGDLDGDGSDEVLADLGATGLWIWDGGAWSIMSSEDAESITCTDLDGDISAEVACDFGSLGLWVWDGGTWSQISGVNADFVWPANIEDGGPPELIVDFGSVGVWFWESGLWFQLSSANADHVVGGWISGFQDEELAGDFGSLGLWHWVGLYWVPLSTANAEFMVCLNITGPTEEDLLADFGSLGLWRYDGTNWIALSSADPDFLAGGDLDGDGTMELLGDFGTLGLWLYDGGVWANISIKDAQ